jgi:hypothetical protein
MQKALDNLLFVAFGVLGSAIVVTAQEMPEGFFGDIGAGAFPAFLGFGLLTSSVIGLTRNTINSSSSFQFKRAQLCAWITMVLLISSFIATWQLTGRFLLSLTGFLLLAFTIYRTDRSPNNLVLNLLVSLCLTAGAYWLFTLTLGVQFD